MITISIFRKSTGNAVQGLRVTVFSDGVTGGKIGENRTDNRGEVHFNHAPVNGRVIVDGSTMYSGRIEGNRVLYI